MKTLVGLAAVLGMLVATPRPADACSVHLIGANGQPRRSVARSARPSSVLVVGDSPRLKRELTAKGHDVEVVSDPDAAKHKVYAAVVTDEKHAEATRAKYGAEHVVVRSADLNTVIASVEHTVTRRPLDHDRKRVALKTQVQRQPTAAGGGTTQLPVRNGGGTAEAGQRQGEGQGEQDQGSKTATQSITASAATGSETPPVPKDVRVPNAARGRSTALSEELFFGLGRANVGSKASIQKTVAWLAAHGSASIVVEGYADPSGSAAANMALSEQRAEAVRDALVAAGADGSRIEVQAFGDTKLHYGRSDGRNRRVVIKAKP